MSSEIPYIDFHTHRQERTHGIVSVQNIIPGITEEIISDGYYSIGIHPWYISEMELEVFFEKVEQFARRKEVIAIGECGLDKLSEIPFVLQQQVFEKQISIAEKLGKPLLIHCVRSFYELVQIKKRTGSSVEWIVHGFNSRLEIADMLLQHEIFISFGKALLNPLSNASKVISQVEDEMIMLETDDNDVKIEEIYDSAAAKLNMDIEYLKLLMQTNFINCFKL
jgi:TatD DNase family protein